MYINKMDFTDKADFPWPNHTYNKHHVPNIKVHAWLFVHILTGTLVLIRLYNKTDLVVIKVDYINEEKFVQMKVSFNLGKNGCLIPIALGGRLIVVVRHWVSETKLSVYLKFDNFSFGVHLGCLKRFVVLIALYW